MRSLSCCYFESLLCFVCGAEVSVKLSCVCLGGRDQRLYRKAVGGCGAGQEAAQRHPGRTQP